MRLFRFLFGLTFKKIPLIPRNFLKSNFKHEAKTSRLMKNNIVRTSISPKGVHSRNPIHSNQNKTGCKSSINVCVNKRFKHSKENSNAKSLSMSIHNRLLLGQAKRSFSWRVIKETPSILKKRKIFNPIDNSANGSNMNKVELFDVSTIQLKIRAKPTVNLSDNHNGLPSGVPLKGLKKKTSMTSTNSGFNIMSNKISSSFNRSELTTILI
jgi:hypothetical protein